MPPYVVLREMAAQMVRRASPLSLASMAEQANRTPPDKGPSIYVQSAAPGARVQEVFMWERDEDNSWRCTALEEHFGSSSAAKSAARPFHKAPGNALILFLVSSWSHVRSWQHWKAEWSRWRRLDFYAALGVELIMSCGKCWRSASSRHMGGCSWHVRCLRHVHGLPLGADHRFLLHVHGHCAARSGI